MGGRKVAMKDKSLNIILMVIFGVSGLFIVALAWFLPSLQSERVMTTLVGIAGIIIAGVNARGLRQKDVGARDHCIPVEVEIKSRS